MKQSFANLTSSELPSSGGAGGGLFALAAACLALLCATPASLRAATIPVTNTADSGPGSLREALASAADGDTIKLTGVSGTITLTSGSLLVSNSLTIIGPGSAKLTVSGNYASRVFIIHSINGTISGLTIANGYGAGIGGGILIVGTGRSVAINNCVITNNSAGADGGGIFNNSGYTMTVSNCTVVDNSAERGGGIINEGTLTVTSSTISSNSAAYRGGGIRNTGTLTVSASTFSGNEASVSGGGIGNEGTLTVSASTFSGNKANGSGGGINNATMPLTITSSTFSGNAANASGGGIYNANATLTINASTFSSNGASDSGGGIYNNGVSGNATLTINASTFSGNYAEDSGGSIYNNADSGNATLRLNASTVSGNRAMVDGGGIYNKAYSGTAALTIIASTVSGNEANGSGGGGIFNYSSSYANAELTINASTVSSNSAVYFGGGIYNETGAFGSSTLTIIASTLSGNAASNSGGGIINYAYPGNAPVIIIIASTVSSNSAVYYGGGIFNEGTLSIDASTFSGNSASWWGGGVFNYGYSANATLWLNASTFSGNSASIGGGIFNDANSASATLEIGDTILNAGTSGRNIDNNLGTVTSFGYNLSSDGGGGFLTNTTDLVNTNALLGPLQDNGGPTFTHALLAGSPAIDKGKRDAIAASTSDTDQRGFPRPSDNPQLANAAGGDGSDIGAFEVLDVTVTKLQAKVNFSPTKSNADSCKLTATLPLGPGFTVSNKAVTVDIGEAQASFTLNAKGIGNSVTNKCKLSYNKKTRLWKLTASMKNGSWAAPWAEYGMENVTTPKKGVTLTMPVRLYIGDDGLTNQLAGVKYLLYKSTANKSGTAK